MKLDKTWPIIILLTIMADISAQSQRVYREHLIYSEAINESRAIWISTPEEYNANDHDYPVLYILDAAYVFDYAIGTVDFLSNPFGYLPDMIIVGLPNTDRNRDFFTSIDLENERAPFVSFLQAEVVPFINENFRTNGFDMLYGWSSASNICTYLFATNPNLIDGYIESGTGIGKRMAAFLEDRTSDHNYNNKYLYALTEGNSPRAAASEKFKETINSINPDGLHSEFALDEESSHVDVLAKGLIEGLKFIFSDFYIPDSIVIQGTESFLKYYEMIDRNYDYDIIIPPGIFNESASILFHHDMGDEAIKLIEHGIRLHPKSVELYGTLGEIYLGKNETKTAAEYFQKALEHSNDTVNHLKFRALLKRLG